MVLDGDPGARGRRPTGRRARLRRPAEAADGFDPAPHPRRPRSDDGRPIATRTAELEPLLERLSRASTRAELAAIAARRPEERLAHALTAETARALHLLLGTAAAGDEDGLTTLHRVTRMAHWLAERARIDAAAAGALALATGVAAELRTAGVRIERADPSSVAARWCLARHAAELERRFARGFDPAPSVPADDAELRPPRGALLVARVGEEAIGCGAVRIIASGVASLDRIWVADSARGVGLGRQMLAALEAEAGALGCATVRLAADRALGEAVRLFRSAGYAEAAPSGDDPHADHRFEKRLG